MSRLFPNARQAATASWVVPLAAFGFGVLVSDTMRDSGVSRLMMWVYAGVILILGFAGLALACAALLSVIRGGQTRAVLVPALLGALLSTGVVASFAVGAFLALRDNNATDQWALYTDAESRYQVEVKGVPIESVEAGEFDIQKVEARSVNGRVLMSVEHVTLSPAWAQTPDATLFDTLTGGSLDYYQATETERNTFGGDDPRTVIRAVIANPPGQIEIVFRRDGDTLLILGYLANAHAVDQADMERFFGSFKRLDATHPDESANETGLGTPE